MNVQIGSADMGSNPTSILGRKWAAEVIFALGDRTLRFNALKKEVNGVTAKMLADILRQMEGGALVHRTHFAVIPPRVEYRLTSVGLDLLAALQPLRALATRGRSDAFG